MLVIMDMEWVDWYGKASPVQISALRVTDDWQEESRFDRIMHPNSEKPNSPDHMAFTGYSREDFLNAPDAVTVFEELSSWLMPGDVLCWWSSPTVSTFIAVWWDLLHEAPPFHLRQIAPSLESRLILAGAPTRGSAYRRLDAIGGPVREKEHCSANDVNVILKLLRALKADPEAIRHCALPEGTENIRMVDLYKPEERGPREKYVLDLSRRLAHRSTCGLIPADSMLENMATLDGVIRSLIPPCPFCLEDEYRRESGKRAEENIRKMQLSFIYTEGDGLFHTPSCIHVRKLPYPLIHGCVRYATAVSRGYLPCKLCNPKEEDEKEPVHTRESFSGLYGMKTQVVTSVYDRTLSRYELNALKRHEQAVRERAAMPSDLTGVAGQDAFVLSQSGYAFWSAVGYQSFHLRDCPKLRGLTHLRGFCRFSDAKAQGLGPCKFCRPSPKNDIPESIPLNQRVRKNETTRDIDTCCDRLGWKHELREDAYYIETPVAKWKMRMGKWPVEVYHMPEGRNEYHKQHRTFLSMTDTVEYIRRHDGDHPEKKGKGSLERMMRDAFGSNSPMRDVPLRRL